MRCWRSSALIVKADLPMVTGGWEGWFQNEGFFQPHKKTCLFGGLFGLNVTKNHPNSNSVDFLATFFCACA